MFRMILVRRIMWTVAVACLISGCSDEPQDKHAHDHGQHGDEHADHGSHHHAGHMAHMREVRDGLKKELGEQYDVAVPAATEAQLAAGKAIYKKLCVACHGESGKGDGPTALQLKDKPADFTDATHAHFYSDRGRIHIIKKGVAGTPMVPWEKALKEDQIMAVFVYIRSMAKYGRKSFDASFAHSTGLLRAVVFACGGHRCQGPPDTSIEIWAEQGAGQTRGPSHQ
jgi:mono/diheme cytochrome c family protein